MPVLGITGGIATGKTTFTNALVRWLPAEVFDADRCARELMAETEIQSAIRERLGSSVFDASNNLDRAKLREIIFTAPESRRELEKILHPRIRSAWTAQAQEIRRSNPHQWLFVDIPLLYETNAQEFFDRTVVVACSAETHLQRLRHERRLSPSLISQMLSAQMPLPQKIELSDHVIWNDGSIAALEEQARIFVDYLRLRT